MKKILKKWWFWVIIIILLARYGYNNSPQVQAMIDQYMPFLSKILKKKDSSAIKP